MCREILYNFNLLDTCVGDAKVKVVESCTPRWIWEKEEFATGNRSYGYGGACDYSLGTKKWTVRAILFLGTYSPIFCPATPGDVQVVGYEQNNFLMPGGKGTPCLCV